MSFKMPTSGSVLPPSTSFHVLSEKISLYPELIPLPQFIEIFAEIDRISSSKTFPNEDCTDFVNLVLSHAANSLTTVIASGKTDDIHLQFLDHLLKFSLLALRGKCSHLGTSGLNCTDPIQLCELLGNIFQFLCNEKCPIYGEAAGEVETAYAKIFFEKILNLCHLSVCCGPRNLILLGISWKAFKIVVSNMGSKLGPSDSEKVFIEWDFIFESIFCEVQKDAGNTFDSLLKFLRFCIAILITTLQSLKELIRYQKQGGLERLILLVLEVRSTLSPWQNFWNADHYSRIVSQIASPLDSLFLQILSIIRVEEKRQLHDILIQRSDSFPPLLQSDFPNRKYAMAFSRSHFSLLLFRHGSKSYPPPFFDLLESCLNFVMESPLLCYSAVIDPELLLFDRIWQTILISITHLQERQQSEFIWRTMEVISKFIFHPHALCRELSKRIWHQYVLNGDEGLISNTRKFLVSFIERVPQSIPLMVKKTAVHFCKPLLSHCFHVDRAPYPLKLTFPFNENCLGNLSHVVVFLPSSSLSVSTQKTICETVLPWCVSAVERKSISQMEYPCVLFNWVTSSNWKDYLPRPLLLKLMEISLRSVTTATSSLTTFDSSVELLSNLYYLYDPAQQFYTLRSLQASVQGKIFLLGSLLHHLRTIISFLTLKGSSHFQEIVKILLSILLLGLNSKNSSLKILAYVSSLELISRYPYDTRSLLSSFGEHERIIIQILSKDRGEIPSLDPLVISNSLNSSVSQVSTRLSSDSTKSPSPNDQSQSIEQPLTQFSNSMKEIDRVLSYLKPSDRVRVVRQMRTDFEATFKKYEANGL
jgi:hypothetical protein